MNTLVAILISIATPLSFGFSSSFTATSLWRHDDVSNSPIKTRQHHVIHQTNQSGDIAPCVRLEASASFGIDPSNELPRLLDVISDVCNEYDVVFDYNSITNTFPSEPSKVVPGALGRVLMIDVYGIATGVNIDENEFISEMKIGISQLIDDCLYSGQLSQPVLLAFQSAATNDTPDSIIEKEVNDYGLRDGLDTSFYTTQDNEHDDGTFIPSSHIKMDGAMIETVGSPGQTHFDTSSILVFDNLLDDTLRKRLLNVVNGISEDGEDTWRDSTDGPNPSRWVRGGLMDVVDNDSDGSGEEDDGPCWGLTEEAIVDICFHDHPAINEFEAKLAQLFQDFIVSRLPEAVLGSCVSPLTANAPCHGDSFDFHIDADPMQVPPSPWADVFGRYPNRSKGKPRFVSVLIYLNDEWNADWGAPTKFLDPPTQECYEVFPKPGRCLVMDQDISHTVVAPSEECGKRPRYSIVWKLILHPKSVGQDMTDLSCGREQLWPTPQLIGSAIQH